jgi:hypothetical protein
LQTIACLAVMLGGFESVSAQQRAGGQRYVLQYRFLPGQKVYYDVSTSMEYTSQVGGTADTAWNKSRARRHYQVQSVDQKGAAVLALMIDQVNMSAQASSTGNIEEFDSSDPAKQPPRYKHVLDRIGKVQATLHVTSRGEPVEVVPNADAPVSANKPVSVGGEASPENFLTLLPDHPVAVNDEWKERFEVDVLNADRLAIKIKMLRSYTLAEVRDGIARINYKTTVLTPVHDPSMSAQLIQRETLGLVDFDINQGEIVSRQASLDRTVVNAFGEKTSLRAVSKYNERQVTSDGQARSPQRAPRL